MNLRDTGFSFVTALLVATAGGCVSWVPTDQQPPTVEDGSVYRGYGDTAVQSQLAPGGCCRVWWVEEGEHATTPEYAAQVAATADRVASALQSAEFPVPRSWSGDRDTSGPLDIYLVRFARGDGAWVADACAAGRCTGFVVMHHQPKGSSPEVLLSHEMFHGSQAAVDSDIPAWFSEGTATWFEEFFWAEQTDFERLASRFFVHEGRSLNDATGVNDSFSYATALFFYFLDRRWGSGVVADTLQGIGRGRAPEESLTMAVDRRASFSEEFLRFWGWNLLTGEFFPPSGEVLDGYPQAQQWPTIASTELSSVPMVWWVTVAPWAAQVATFRGDVGSGIPLSLTVDWSLEADGNRTMSEVGVVAAWLDAAGSPHLHLASAPPLSVQAPGARFVRIAVVNSSWQTSTDVRVSLY